MNNALFDTDLYDSLEQRNQQISPVQQRQAAPLSAPNINSSNQPLKQPPPHKQLPPRQSNMNSTDIFMPSAYDTGPPTFLSNFGNDDQLFQQPLFNDMGQNYVPNSRPAQLPLPQQQTTQQQYEKRDATFDNNYRRASPPLRPAYAPPQQQKQQPPPPPSNRQVNYNDNNDPFSEYHEMFAPSRYQRPSTPPSQQQQRRTPPSERRPPPPQQQRPPPQPQYPRSYQPPQQQQQQQSRYHDESLHQQSNEMFFTDHNDDQMDQFSHHQLSTRPASNQHNEHDQDSRRQGKH